MIPDRPQDPEGPSRPDSTGPARQDRQDQEDLQDAAPPEPGAPPSEDTGATAPTDSADPETAREGEASAAEPEPDSLPDGIALVEPEQDDPPGTPDDPTLHAETEARLRAVSAAYHNLKAEMRALQDRVERQREDQRRRHRGEVVAAVFEPVQNLRRSIEAFQRSQVADEVVEGLTMILDQFIDAFGKLGLEEIPGAGARFDPIIHEAMGTVPVTDPAQDGVVLQVFDTGYRIGRQVIQPARVIIGTYRAPEPAEE